jgi:YggT family protein
MMGGGYLANPAIFLIQMLFGFYILLVMLRFMLQLVKADFYNPVSQFIVKATSPVLIYLRRIIPGFGGIDLASILLMWLLKALELTLIAALVGLPISIMVFAWAIPELIKLVFDVFIYSILIQVVMSWINPGAYNPAMSIVNSITEPVLTPARRILPPMGGLDLSPMLAMMGLYVIRMLLLPPIQQLVGIPIK